MHQRIHGRWRATSHSGQPIPTPVVVLPHWARFTANVLWQSPRQALTCACCVETSGRASTHHRRRPAFVRRRRTWHASSQLRRAAWPFPRRFAAPVGRDNNANVVETHPLTATRKHGVPSAPPHSSRHAHHTPPPPPCRLVWHDNYDSRRTFIGGASSLAGARLGGACW